MSPGSPPRDLRAFYRKHYRPDGAVLVLAGDLEPASALAKVDALFGTLSRGHHVHRPRSFAEPAQVERRDFTLVEPEALPRGLLGWHTVPRGHVDTPALDVLADLVSAGRQSRLWLELVEESKLATWVEAAHASAHRGGQFLVQIESVAGHDPEEIERRILGIVSDLAEYGPTEEELNRARNRLEAGWRWEQEDLAGIAAGIGHAALWGDWRDWQAEHAAALRVDSAAIRAAAGRYLIETNLTAGWSLPRAYKGRPVLESQAARATMTASSDKDNLVRTSRLETTAGESLAAGRFDASDRGSARNHEADRLPSQAVGPGQWTAGDPRTTAGYRSGRTGVACRRRVGS